MLVHAEAHERASLAAAAARARAASSAGDTPANKRPNRDGRTRVHRDGDTRVCVRVRVRARRGGLPGRSGCPSER